MTLRRASFIKWLKGQPMEREFKRGTCMNCPIHWWSRETGLFGRRPYWLAIARTVRAAMRTGWQRTFIVQFDNGDGPTGSVRECLEILEEYDQRDSRRPRHHREGAGGEMIKGVDFETFQTNGGKWSWELRIEGQGVVARGLEYDDLGDADNARKEAFAAAWFMQEEAQ